MRLRMKVNQTKNRMPSPSQSTHAFGKICVVSLSLLAVALSSGSNSHPNGTRSKTMEGERAQKKREVAGGNTASDGVNK